MTHLCSLQCRLYNSFIVSCCQHRLSAAGCQLSERGIVGASTAGVHSNCVQSHHSPSAVLKKKGGVKTYLSITVLVTSLWRNSRTWELCRLHIITLHVDVHPLIDLWFACCCWDYIDSSQVAVRSQLDFKHLHGDIWCYPVLLMFSCLYFVYYLLLIATINRVIYMRRSK